MSIEPRRAFTSSPRTWCAVGLGLVAVGLGAGCGSSGQSGQPGTQTGSTVGAKPAVTCPPALNQYASVRRDLQQALSVPSDPATAQRLFADAEALKASLAKLVPPANADQQAALSQYRSELRDAQTALNVARSGDTSTATGLLRASAGQLAGLPKLIHALCKT